MDKQKQIDLGQRLKTARKNRKLSRADVFGSTHINQMSLSCYESGSTAIPALRLQRLADLYGVTVQWLLTGADSQVESPEFQHAMQLFVEAGAKFIEAGNLLKGQ